MASPHSTLNDRARGGRSAQEAHEKWQKLPPGVERALMKWADMMEASGFPPRLDLFKAMAALLAQKRADEGDPELANLG